MENHPPQIDLNIPFVGEDFGSGYVQLGDEGEFSLPDLNVPFPNENNEQGKDDDTNQLPDLNEPLMEAHIPSEEGDLDEDEILDADHSSEGVSRCNRTLTNEERRAVFTMLLQKSDNGKVRKGVTKEVALYFSINLRTVQRIWKLSGKGNNPYADVCHRKTENCGRKRIEIDYDHIRQLPLGQRTTLRSLAISSNVKKTTLFRRLREGNIRRHTNVVKPFLTDENKISRLKFCLSMLDGDSIPHSPTFVEMYNFIHVDEKWFYMTKKCENYYLLPDEEDPLRTCKSTSFIGKVMFLVAIARPRFDPQGNETFSGKISVFPFVTKEPTKRSSANRPAGTLETKPITSVKRELYKSYLIEKVIPSIKECWPIADRGYTIFIQKDNERTHIAENDAEFCEAATQDGFDIRLICQPPNSPDLNVLDLGFFRAIQALQYKERPKSVDDLVNAVVKAYEDYSTKLTNRIFLTLQMTMIEIMRAKGAHKYKIPHVDKEKLEKEGRLPTRIRCDPELVQEVLRYLN